MSTVWSKILEPALFTSGFARLQSSGYLARQLLAEGPSHQDSNHSGSADSCRWAWFRRVGGILIITATPGETVVIIFCAAQTHRNNGGCPYISNQPGASALHQSTVVSWFCVQLFLKIWVEWIKKIAVAICGQCAGSLSGRSVFVLIWLQQRSALVSFILNVELWTRTWKWESCPMSRDLRRPSAWASWPADMCQPLSKNLKSQPESKTLFSFVFCTDAAKHICLWLNPSSLLERDLLLNHLCN